MESKRVYRIYRELESNLRIKPYGFQYRSTHQWPAFSNSFNVLDDFDCEGLGIEVEVTLRSVRITRVLDRIIEWYGKPGKILCDNGPENISGLLQC